MPNHQATTTLLQERMSDLSESIEVCAAAAVALSKHDPQALSGNIDRLVNRLESKHDADRVMPAMAAAYAFAQSTERKRAQNIPDNFPKSLRPFARYAVRIQGRPMTADDAKTSEMGEDLIQMVRISPGEDPFGREFVLGSDDRDDEAFEKEKPPTVIAMKNSFAIGRYAVTQEELITFTKAMGKSQPHHSDKPRWPAMLLDWREANSYCTWLEMITGDLYRLPSEVEWEYACRSGTSTKYSWGDEFSVEMANSNQKSLNATAVSTKDVSSYAANHWGLWNMHGNVYEFCADTWHPSHASRPSGQNVWAETGEYRRRVVRGGSTDSIPTYLRSAYRSRDSTGSRNEYLGFRLARTLNPWSN